MRPLAMRPSRTTSAFRASRRSSRGRQQQGPPAKRVALAVAWVEEQPSRLLFHPHVEADGADAPGVVEVVPPLVVKSLAIEPDDERTVAGLHPVCVWFTGRLAVPVARVRVVRDEVLLTDSHACR